MSKKENTKQVITHPDNLVQHREYSLVIQSGGKLRRITGTFLAMQTAYDGMTTVVPTKPVLVMVLRRNIDTIFVPWLASKNWVLVD